MNSYQRRLKEIADLRRKVKMVDSINGVLQEQNEKLRLKVSARMRRQEARALAITKAERDVHAAYARQTHQLWSRIDKYAIEVEELKERLAKHEAP